MKAIWKNTVIAESDETVVVERNHYFPAASVQQHYLKKSQTHTFCPWKGQASYYHLCVDGAVNEDAVWSYPETRDAAKNIEGYFAFWHGVQIES